MLWLRSDAPLAGELSELDVWMFFYPELDQTNVVRDTEDDTHFDVLFLGGSVFSLIEFCLIVFFFCMSMFALFLRKTFKKPLIHVQEFVTIIN